MMALYWCHISAIRHSAVYYFVALDCEVAIVIIVSSWWAYLLLGIAEFGSFYTFSLFRYQWPHNGSISLLRYSVFYANRDESEVFVATARAARNMSFQGMTAEDGKVHYVDGLQSVWFPTNISLVAFSG